VYLLLRVIRAVFGFMAAWQILGLLPVVGWLQNIESASGGMWAIALVKIVMLLVFGTIFYGLRALINKLHFKKHGTQHPALVGRWSL
jgi:hypothetical protein